MTDTGTGAASEPAVSHRIWTVPNALSMLRLVGVPIFLWLILAEHDVAAFVVLALSGVTDYLDGKIARRYGLISRLGQLLDPIADRLYILSTLLGLAWRDIIPWWLVVVLLAREAFVGAMAPWVRHHRLAIPPVHFVGKAATFNLIYAFPLLLLADGDSVVADIAQPLGWAFAWWGTGLYWLAAALYAVQVRGMVQRKKAVIA
ncbi:CDP-alcohol phosphatidyltransferase family protein [Luteipulveratus halotolerans]|uniref:CDP-diacylglycerol--glycerol-3-phosphate 3-phosphatidyltransferase n=1 Tax=Luteipulveratus halotolerans TaxID=1631356 RepID=A0A0L6CHC8_9MICO|nr:CDP-alcohol phosphatidyltransferase family protein [Luteipulveratus halotolerans]KNX37129.1 CDP-diacylglycerol--glycerol-3-phosphate 3-phosphatidyltransferase [Luteipulveratus halotolerans]